MRFETVFRVVHNFENPYVQVCKETVADPNLSLKALGLLTKCLSRPNDWRFNVTELSNSGKDGKKSIYSTIEELITLRYAIKIKHTKKTKDGRFESGGTEYVFFEVPITEEDKIEYTEKFKKCFRQTPFGKVGDGLVGNGPLLKNKELKNDKNNHPLTPKKEPKKEEGVSKSSLMKKIHNASEEEFEYAWSEYEKAPIGSVKSIGSWIRSVILRRRYELQCLEEKNNLIEKHKKQAEAMERKKPQSIAACRDRVEFINGVHVKVVPYDISEVEWTTKTGFFEIAKAGGIYEVSDDFRMKKFSQNLKGAQ